MGGQEGLLEVVSLEVMAEGIRTVTHIELAEENSRFWRCDAVGAKCRENKQNGK